MSTLINHNGKLAAGSKMFISPDNRSFRYGDGCFETIKVVNGNILLGQYHFERLLSSLKVLHFKIPHFYSADYFTKQIIELLTKNGHSKNARIRITAYRGDGGIYDEVSFYPNFIIQSWPVNKTVNELNQNGLDIDFFREAQKSCDSFSSLKSNNYLPYLMGAIYAKENQLNDSLILNPYGRVSDATIANVFIVSNGTIRTPALTEGCVAGVMRRHLLKCFGENDMLCEETEITVEDVLSASEIFLTNAISGIKWVKKCADSQYSNSMAAQLHKQFIEPLFK